MNKFLCYTKFVWIGMSKRQTTITRKCAKLGFLASAIVTFLNLFCIYNFNISLKDFLLVDLFYFIPLCRISALKTVLIKFINILIWKQNKITRSIFNFNMSLPSHGHRFISVVIKLLLICNGIKKGTNYPIKINLPLVFILLIVFIVVLEFYLPHDGFICWW